MFSRLLRNLIVLLLPLTVCSVRASDWWDAQWTIRKPITLDLAAAQLGGDVGSPTVLVRLHEGVFNFASAKPDLADVRFVAEDGKTLLPFQIEKIDPLMNEAYLWVHLPEITAGKPVRFWLYYGNAGDKAQRIDADKPTWAPSTQAVFHFSDSGTSAADSSGNGLDLQGAVVRSEGGLIGGALRLDGKNGLSLSDASRLNLGASSSLTVAGWVKPAADGSRPLVAWRSNRSSLVLGLDNGMPYAESGSTAKRRAMASVAVGAWHHVAYVLAGDAVRFYVDGEPAGSAELTTPEVASAPVVGTDGRSAGFSGELDELTVHNGALSAASIRFMAVTQGANGASVVVVGPDEIPQGFFQFLKEGYVGVIISSLTFDAWLVIVICFFMSIISWIVMVKKARWLNRIVKGNDVFLKLWHEVSNDLSVIDSENVSDAQTMGGRISPDQGALMRESSLYQVYHVGVEEIRHRITATSGGVPVIKSRSIHAIKAMLEGSMIRQTQKLNANMVLLTIAISGGPFLGLLGTVVGVMITFAAVAQAGEVNVNAIAPGIAAALAATCAGLGVAIPALFGYNYLLTRIKSTTTDMTVFIDEFVTKLAEFYGGEGGHD